MEAPKALTDHIWSKVEEALGNQVSLNDLYIIFDDNVTTAFFGSMQLRMFTAISRTRHTVVRRFDMSRPGRICQS